MEVPAGRCCRFRCSRDFGYAHLHDYQRARIDTFLHPESDPLGAGYNIIQSKIALGSGGLWGKGFLQGTQGHLDFLPEKQTDFIFTMIGEEFGLVGGLAVMALLGLIILGGMLIALRCRNQFGRLVALGIAVQLLPLCVRQHRHGDGRYPGGRRAAAAGLARRFGDADGDGRLWRADVGACASRRRIRRRSQCRVIHQAVVTLTRFSRCDWLVSLVVSRGQIPARLSARRWPAHHAALGIVKDRAAADDPQATLGSPGSGGAR